MKKVAFFIGLSSLLFLACPNNNPPGPQPEPNLHWEGIKEYDPSSGKLMVEGLGINDSVDIVDPVAFMVERKINNDGAADVSTSYILHEQITPMVLQINTGSVGFDTTDRVVFDQAIAGPALAVGATDSVNFGPIGPLPCGMYRERLRIDTTNAIAESNETDNESFHYFFVPSTQNFGLSKNEILQGIGHEVGRTATTTFTITPGIDTVIFAHFSFVSTEGSTADVVPPPPITVLPGAPLTVTMFVTTQEHQVTSGFELSITGKVTAISADGCIIRQESAKVYVEHDEG